MFHAVAFGIRGTVGYAFEEPHEQRRHEQRDEQEKSGPEE